MTELNIRQIFSLGWDKFSSSFHPSPVQDKAAHSIMDCKTGVLGYSVSLCPDCGHTQIHNCSCRNRNCPNCQAVLKELWIDKRRAEVIDSPYFHVVFTLPHELNPLLCCNQTLLYGLLHRCCAQTLLELSADRKYLGAIPGIIQVLHTWNQELGYHVHMHCIISGGGLTCAHQLRKSSAVFLSRSESYGINSRENIFPACSCFTRRGSSCFPRLVNGSAILMNGTSSGTTFTTKTGALS